MKLLKSHIHVLAGVLLLIFLNSSVAQDQLRDARHHPEQQQLQKPPQTQPQPLSQQQNQLQPQNQNLHRQPQQQQALPTNPAAPQRMEKNNKKMALSKEEEEFLEAHNEVRREAREPPYEWDSTLADYARWWGIRRMKDCRLIHSYGPFGENIFWGGKKHWTPRDAVKIWAGEDKYYNARANKCEANKLCGHYTQIVWRGSTKLGCARTECTNGGVLLICSYYVPGNIEAEGPFDP